MRQRDSFRKLARARVRLSRVRDGKIMAGTLRKMSATQIELDLNGVEQCLPAETFMVEVHGPVMKLVFAARLQRSMGTTAFMEVSQDIKFLASSEPARLAVDGFTVLAKWATDEMVGKIIDISKQGVCMLLHEEIASGSMVHLEIRNKLEVYHVRGVVRYCIEQNDGLGHCRLGIQLIHDERVNSARWMTLIDRIVDAA